MASPSYHLKLKPLHSFHVFSLKSPSSISTNTTTSSTKLKTLAHTFILSHICRIVRALAKAKIILVGIFKDIQLVHLTEFTTKKHKNKKKIFCGSFRMHYNWCSSHVLPVASPQENAFPVRHSYYDATWDSIISPGCDEMEESQLSGYLHWLEKKVNEDSKKTNDMNEIDRLADMFIANCHEKFKLEKQESYRMFQEMMARSVRGLFFINLLILSRSCYNSGGVGNGRMMGVKVSLTRCNLFLFRLCGLEDVHAMRC